MPRVLLLTSTFLRHMFFVQHLANNLEVTGVWQEEKSFKPEIYAKSEDDEKVIADHFFARDESEEKYFGAYNNLNLQDDVIHRKLSAGSINSQEELDIMKEYKPDIILVFGTGILKDEIIDLCPGNIINLHLGLSPYYRGSGTNFWPLVNGEPEYVGATIHYLDKGIDSGAMICHVRPYIEIGDGPHDLGNKTIQKAVEVLPSVVSAHYSGNIKPVKQEGDGKLYLRKHFNADSVRKLYENFESGMIEQYLADKEGRDQAIDLIPPPTK